MFRRLVLILTPVFLLLPSIAKAEEKDKKVGGKSDEITVRQVFADLESPALELLTKEMRLDMLDYWDVDSVYKVSNVMDGLSWIEKKTDSYLKVHITNVSNIEIKILPEKKENIVMTIYTVGSDPQAADSQINFYDSTLKPIETSKHLKLPELKDFFEIPKGSRTSMKEIREMVPFPTIAYSVSPDLNQLTATLTVGSYISPDDWNIVKLFVKPDITADWKKEKFTF